MIADDVTVTEKLASIDEIFQISATPGRVVIRQDIDGFGYSICRMSPPVIDDLVKKLQAARDAAILMDEAK